ncbi:MAG: hypothetical protein WBB98_15570 [Xanthobacteraceae bacterium]
MAKAADNPTLSQLLYTHEKLENLARGPLSAPVVEQMKETAHELVLEIGTAPASDWDEFMRKLKVLLGDYMDVHEIMFGIEADLLRLRNPRAFAHELKA